MFDGKAFGEEIVGIVRDYLERKVAPLKAENESLKVRLAALEERPAPEKGDPGEKGEDGISPEPQAIAEAFAPLASDIIAKEVEKAVQALPPPERGEPGERGADGKDGADGRDGADGTSVTIEDVAPLIAEQVAKAVAEIPLPKDGIDGKDGRDGADGKDGRDGRGVKDLLIDREGQLVATMDNGEMKVLGPVIGKDGARGKDGRDGFSLEDFDACVLEDDRTVQFAFRSDEHEHIATLKWPTAIYRGVFKDGSDYERGDMVTWAGSLWHCDEPTKDKPGTDSWTLAAKKGRDGRDAKGDGK